MGVVGRILGQIRSRLELSHKENRVDFIITCYFQLVGQSTYLFDDLERTDVLLGQFLSYTNGGRNRVALMKFKYYLISKFHKQGLIAPIVIIFLICESKKYCVSGLGMGHLGVGSGSGQTQIKKSSRRESVGNFVWCFSHSRGGGVMK